MTVNTGEFYRRFLPHWRKEYATYFITFRAVGSLPSHLKDQAEAEIASVTQRLKDQGRPSSEHELERVNICERMLDQDITNPILRNPDLASLVRDAILFHHGNKYDLYAWCIMPSHVHLLLTPLRTAERGGAPNVARP